MINILQTVSAGYLLCTITSFFAVGLWLQSIDQEGRYQENRILTNDEQNKIFVAGLVLSPITVCIFLGIALYWLCIFLRFAGKSIPESITILKRISDQTQLERKQAEVNKLMREIEELKPFQT